MRVAEAAPSDPKTAKDPLGSTCFGGSETSPRDRGRHSAPARVENGNILEGQRVRAQLVGPAGQVLGRLVAGFDHAPGLLSWHCQSTITDQPAFLKAFA
jgi:hypothetical protein